MRWYSTERHTGRSLRDCSFLPVGEAFRLPKYPLRHHSLPQGNISKFCHAELYRICRRQIYRVLRSKTYRQNTPSRGGGWVNEVNPGGGMACTTVRKKPATMRKTQVYRPRSTPAPLGHPLRLRYPVFSLPTGRLPRPPTAAHTALALDSATGGGQARGPGRGYLVRWWMREAERLPYIVKAQDTMFHFLHTGNSTCILAFPLPTKAVAFAGSPLYFRRGRVSRPGSFSLMHLHPLRPVCALGTSPKGRGCGIFQE